MGWTELFARSRHMGAVDVTNKGISTGARFWVNSATGSDAAGYGLSPEAPFATLGYAFSSDVCTANAGDIIYVAENHGESWTTTGAKVVADIAGVRVVGLGTGSTRPTFTFGHTGTTWTLSAADLTFENLLFVTAVDSVTTFATISGDDCKMINCEFRDVADIETISHLTVSGDRFHEIGCFHNGYTGGNANVRMVYLDGVDGALLQGNRYLGKVTTACIGFVGHACTNVVIKDSDFLVTSTTNLAKNVVDTITGSTWEAANCFDIGAGYTFQGGSGAAVAGISVTTTNTKVDSVGTLCAGIATNGTKIDSVGTLAAGIATGNTKIDSVGTLAAGIATGNTKVDSVGTLAAGIATTNAWDVKTVSKALDLDNGSVEDAFTVSGGPVLIMGLITVITEAVSAHACNAKWQNDPTAADFASTDLCDNVDLNAAAVGNCLYITGVSANAQVKVADGTALPLMCTVPVLAHAGGIDLVLANSDPTSGAGTAYLTYRPLVSGAAVTPAA